MLWTRLQMGVCESLLPDVVALEAYQNVCSYVHEVSGSTLNSLCKNLTWWAVTRKTSINHTTVKIRGWALVWGWVLAWDNMVLYMNFAQTNQS